MAAITAISVLVLAEDPATSGAVVRLLLSGGFLVHEARSEDDAIRQASEATPDLVILDLFFEEGPGTAVCRRLRELPNTEDIPILALTGSHDVTAQVRLLELGCDDCLVRSSEPEELFARVHALLRRRRGDRLVRRIGPLRVHLIGGDAWMGTRALDLTAGERAILSTLARAYPSVAQRAALDRLPWRAATDVSSNVTEVLVARLRQKLAAAGGGVEIRTVRRTGYRFETGETTEAGT